MVLLAAFAHLHSGKPIALRRSINFSQMELRVRVATTEMDDGTQVDRDPKSKAEERSISLPAGLQGDIETHLDRYAEAGRTMTNWSSCRP